MNAHSPSPFEHLPPPPNGDALPVTPMGRLQAIHDELERSLPQVAAELATTMLAIDGLKTDHALAVRKNTVYLADNESRFHSNSSSQGLIIRRNTTKKDKARQTLARVMASRGLTPPSGLYGLGGADIVSDLFDTLFAEQPGQRNRVTRDRERNRDNAELFRTMEQGTTAFIDRKITEANQEIKDRCAPKRSVMPGGNFDPQTQDVIDEISTNQFDEKLAQLVDQLEKAVAKPVVSTLGKLSIHNSLGKYDSQFQKQCTVQDRVSRMARELGSIPKNAVNQKIRELLAERGYVAAPFQEREAIKQQVETKLTQFLDKTLEPTLARSLDAAIRRSAEQRNAHSGQNRQGQTRQTQSSQRIPPRNDRPQAPQKESRGNSIQEKLDRQIEQMLSAGQSTTQVRRSLMKIYHPDNGTHPDGEVTRYLTQHPALKTRKTNSSQ